MIELDIPGRGLLQIHHLVMEVNGTLAVYGILLEGLAKRISLLRDRLEVHLLAADLVATDIFTALDLLDRPMRIVASLRT